MLFAGNLGNNNRRWKKLIRLKGLTITVECNIILISYDVSQKAKQKYAASLTASYFEL